MNNQRPNRHSITGPAFLLLLAWLIACAACSSSRGPGRAGGDDSDVRPEITDEKIRQDILWHTVENIRDETNTNKPISWTFIPEEPKEITVLEKQVSGDTANVVLDVKTRSAPRAKNQRQLSGKIRLHYELQTELFLRKWRITHIENVSMSYRNEQAQDQEKETEKEKQKEKERQPESDEGEDDG